MFYFLKNFGEPAEHASLGSEFSKWSAPKDRGILGNWYSDPRLEGYITNHATRGHIRGDLERYWFVAAFREAMGYSPKSGNFPKTLHPNHANFVSGKFADRFRAQGWDVDLQAHIRRGGQVLGLCGGFQMLGTEIEDPEGLEGAASRTPGLGLLDVATVMQPEKQVRTVSGQAARSGAPFTGYEIHIGETKGRDLARPLLEVDGAPHGAVSKDACVMGAYIHGLFESGAFRRDFLQNLGAVSDGQNHDEKVDRALDELAEAMESTLDIDGLLNLAAVPSR